MRIDKIFSELGILSRKDCAIALKRGKITVDGITVKNADTHIDENNSAVTYNGETVNYKKFVYIMLNKPLGYVSATEDANENTVLDLLPDNLRKLNLFPCGRLDKDTVGLVMLTNDGVAAHRLLSPKNHVTKKYKFECLEALTDTDITQLETGVDLIDGYTTKPCTVEKLTDYSGYIILTEGKYHQIKRMFGALHNKISYLERITFSTIELDKNLARGEWRFLNAEEEKVFKSIE